MVHSTPKLRCISSAGIQGIRPSHSILWIVWWSFQSIDTFMSWSFQQFDRGCPLLSIVPWMNTYQPTGSGQESDPPAIWQTFFTIQQEALDRLLVEGLNKLHEHHELQIFLLHSTMFPQKSHYHPNTDWVNPHNPQSGSGLTSEYISLS